MSLDDTLHDEIDAIEDFQDRATSAVDDMRRMIRTELLRNVGPDVQPEQVVEMVAAAVHASVIAVGESLTDVTSDAFKTAAQFAKARRA